MDVRNLAWNEKLSNRCNHPILLQGIRDLIIDKSETTLLINILLCPGWLDYNNIKVFAKSLFQPEYHILKKAFEEKLPITQRSNYLIVRNQNEIMDLGISLISIVEENGERV